MKCPQCQNEDTSVTETRQTPYGTRRSRMCSTYSYRGNVGCRYRWTTVEIDADVFCRLIESASLVLDFVDYTAKLGKGPEEIWDFIRDIRAKTGPIRNNPKRLPDLSGPDPEEVMP